MITPKELTLPEDTKGLRYALIRAWREMVAKANYHLIQWRDEGTDIGGVGQVNKVNFTGAGVSTAVVDDTLTVTVSGGGGGGLSDGDYGDITVSGGATALTIDAGAVSTSKMGGDVTAAGKALLDDADAAAQRATLGIDAAADARIAAASVNALSDVTVTAPSVGQVLKWNGSAWINDSDATGGGGGGNFVEAEVDFGSGKSDATVVITGQAGILTTSKVNAWIFPKATTDHTADEHWLETISVHAGNIVAGTGFTIYAKNTNTLNEPVEAYNRGGKGGKGTFLYGKYTVQASWG